MKISKTILFVILIGTIMSICGCTCNEPRQNLNRVNEETLTSSLSQTLKNTSNIISDEEVPGYITYMEEKSTFQVVYFDETNETTINSKVNVKAPDLYSAIIKLQNEGNNIDESQFDLLIVNELKNASILETEVEMQFQLVDGEYQPILSDSFLNAYYGGIFKLREEWINSMVEGD